MTPRRDNDSRRYSLADVVVVILLLGVGLYSPYLLPKPIPATSLQVRTPEGVKSISLVRDQVLEVDGKDGPTIIEIDSGRTRIVRSTCPDNHRHQVEGWIAQGGAALACVPNQVVLDLSGNGFDSVMR